MSVIIIPRRHYTQPQGRVALSPHCDAAIGTTFSEHLGRTEQWLAGGSRFVQNNGTAPISSPVGHELVNPTALTMLSVWRAKKGAQYYGADLSSRVFSTFVSAGGYGFGRTSAVGGGATGNLTRQVFTLYGVADYSHTAHTIPSLIDVCVATVWHGNGKNVEFWDDGGTVGALTLRESKVTGALNGIGAPFLLGANNVEGVFKGAVSVLLVWPRALGAAELIEYGKNPWQLFRADPIRIYSLPSGPISVSWSSLTASNITQTGARLTLGGITR